MILCLQKIKFLFDSFAIFCHGKFEWLCRLWRTLNDEEKKGNENLIKEEKKVSDDDDEERKESHSTASN